MINLNNYTSITNNNLNIDLLFHVKEKILSSKQEAIYNPEISMIIAIEKGSNLDIVLKISGNMFWIYLKKIFNKFLIFNNYNENCVSSIFDVIILNQNLEILKEKKYNDNEDNIYYEKKENIICYVKPNNNISGGNKKGGGFFDENEENENIRKKLLKIKFYMAYLIMLNPFLTSINIHNILQKLINIIYKDEEDKNTNENVISDKYIDDLGLKEYCENIGKYYINELPYKII